MHEHPNGDNPNKVVKYIEVTEAAYYPFDLVLNCGYEFKRCDALIYELYVDGRRIEGVIADREAYDDGNEVGHGR